VENMTILHSNKNVTNFIDALNNLRDRRDNRGKRHSLPFVTVSVVLAILAGRSRVSSIFRYICNKIEWQCEITGIPDAAPISRAHLPRLLELLDWEELNDLIETYFDVRLDITASREWVAIDGKVLKGATGTGNKQAAVLALTHESRILLAQAKQTGSKSSEIPAVRQLLRETGLEKSRVTLDAHHCNPATTAQIHQAGGRYLIQVKENQPILLRQCRELAAQNVLIGKNTDKETGHGRITTRRARTFSMNTLNTDARRADSGLQTLVAIKRKTVDMRTRKTSRETSYYVSNQEIEKSSPEGTQELALAVRKHWSVESDNWIRDVTLNEDNVKTTSGKQAQIMGSLRSLAMRLLRKSGVKNFQAAIETFSDCADKFEAMLRRVKFL